MMAGLAGSAGFTVLGIAVAGSAGDIGVAAAGYPPAGALETVLLAGEKKPRAHEDETAAHDDESQEDLHTYIIPQTGPLKRSQAKRPNVTWDICSWWAGSLTGILSSRVEKQPAL